MTHSNCVTWLLQIVWHDSSFHCRCTWLGTAPMCVCNDTFVMSGKTCVTWFVWHDSFIGTHGWTWHLCVWDMTHYIVWHDLCDITHTPVHIGMSHSSCCVTWIVWQDFCKMDSFIGARCWTRHLCVNDMTHLYCLTWLVWYHSYINARSWTRYRRVCVRHDTLVLCDVTCLTLLIQRYTLACLVWVIVWHDLGDTTHLLVHVAGHGTCVCVWHGIFILWDVTCATLLSYRCTLAWLIRVFVWRDVCGITHSSPHMAGHGTCVCDMTHLYCVTWLIQIVWHGSFIGAHVHRARHLCACASWPMYSVLHGPYILWDMTQEKNEREREKRDRERREIKKRDRERRERKKQKKERSEREREERGRK